MIIRMTRECQTITTYTWLLADPATEQMVSKAQNCHKRRTIVIPELLPCTVYCLLSGAEGYIGRLQSACMAKELLKVFGFVQALCVSVARSDELLDLLWVLQLHKIQPRGLQQLVLHTTWTPRCSKCVKEVTHARSSRPLSLEFCQSNM